MQPGAPGGLAPALEVKGRVGLVADGDHLARLCVDTAVSGLGLEQRSDDLAVSVQDLARPLEGNEGRGRRG